IVQKIERIPHYVTINTNYSAISQLNICRNREQIEVLRTKLILSLLEQL
ncbi:unnamed protein product, partial [marine sediment metagenome]